MCIFVQVIRLEPFLRHDLTFNFNCILSHFTVLNSLILTDSYTVVLDSDDAEYGGHRRLDPNTEYKTFAEGWDNRMNHMFVSVRIRGHNRPTCLRRVRVQCVCVRQFCHCLKAALPVILHITLAENLSLCPSTSQHPLLHTTIKSETPPVVF